MTGAIALALFRLGLLCTLFCWLLAVPGAGASLLVRVQDPRAHPALTKARLKLVRQYKYIPWALYEGDGPALARGRQALKSLKVESCPAGAMHLAAVPNDPLYLPDQIDFHPGKPDADIFLPQAWDLRRDAANIVVAVIDNGIDASHPDLVNNLWTNPAEAAGQPGVDDDHNGFIDDVHGWNFVENNNDLFGDNPWHGTMVSGVIGAEGNNTTGTAGVCWKVQIMTLRAFSDVVTSNTQYILDAFEYAMSRPNVRIINASWGGDPVPPIYDEIVAAGQKGILVVAAAGNNSRDLDAAPFYPASYDLDNLVSVAAITSVDSVGVPAGSLASFSNYGSQVSLAAPGDPVYSTQPGGLYGNGSGTSFSTPIVCGAVALMITRDPSLTPAQLKQRLIATARHTDALALSGKPLASGLLNVQRFLLGPPGAARPGWALYR